MGRLRGGRGLTRSPGSALPPRAGDGLGSELGVRRKGKLQKVEHRLVFPKYLATVLFEIANKYF